MTEAELRKLALGGLNASPPPWPSVVGSIAEVGFGPSDFDLNPELAGASFAVQPHKRAAVLLPIVVRNELSVLLTQRTDTLSSHAGQIAFPGGRIDPEDAGPREAALREAREEIGLAGRHVNPIGYLDTYRTGTGFVIVPVVGLVEPGFTLTLNPQEVVSTFEVPLSFLLDQKNHRQVRRILKGQERFFYAIEYGKHYIWGATAGMIRNMSERLMKT